MDLADGLRRGEGMDETDSEYTPYPSDESSMTASDSSISMAAAKEEEEEEESELEKRCKSGASGGSRAVSFVSDEVCESEFGE